MKVRIGVSIGSLATPARLGEAARLLEKTGVDSLWLSEVVSRPRPDEAMAAEWPWH